MSEGWRAPALNPPRAFGDALGTAVLRREPEDFRVEEVLGFEPSGSGQHLLLKVRKRDANTQWVARELSRLAGCRVMDVGYAGLKDRRAIAIQWFTVPRAAAPIESWVNTGGPQFTVLEAHAHSRKLPRGALSGNRFVLRIGVQAADGSAVRERLGRIASHGVPNYFGPQRFGRDGSNLDRIAAGLQSLHSGERGFVLSAARSLIFNAVLAERVSEQTWQHLQIGDLANLDGSGSVFAVERADEALRSRAQRLDIHPTGPMWGRGEPRTAGRILELERRIAAGYPVACSLTQLAGMDQERRALRIAVRDLESSLEGNVLVLSFRLDRGSFATTVVRVVFELAPGSPE